MLVGSDARIWLRTGNCNGNADNCQIGACTGANGWYVTIDHGRPRNTRLTNDSDGVAFGSVGATVAEFGMSAGTYGDFYDGELDAPIIPLSRIGDDD